jgi:hypothetical protein
MFYIPGATTPTGRVKDYYSDGEPFTLNGFQYPGNFPKADVGGQMVTYGPRPNERFYAVAEVFDGAHVAYTGEPKPLDALKSQMIAQVKATAGALLAPTDWRVVRAAEGVKPLDEVTATHRDAVRAASNLAEAAILACTTIEDLAALPEVTWPKL